jgi:hypothetical protein
MTARYAQVHDSTVRDEFERYCHSRVNTADEVVSARRMPVNQWRRTDPAAVDLARRTSTPSGDGPGERTIGVRSAPGPWSCGRWT